MAHICLNKMNRNTKKTKSMNVLFIEGKGNKICISFEKKKNLNKFEIVDLLLLLALCIQLIQYLIDNRYFGVYFFTCFFIKQNYIFIALSIIDTHTDVLPAFINKSL